MDASNMLKPALAYGEIRLVGATTVDEYRKNLEKDSALERRLQPSSSARHPLTRPSRSCVASRTATRRTTASRSPKRQSSPLSSSPTATLPTASSRIRLSTCGPGFGEGAPAHEDQTQEPESSGRGAEESSRGEGSCGRGLREDAGTRGESGRRARADRGIRRRSSSDGGGGDGRGHRRVVSGHRHPGEPAHRGGA